MRRLAAVNILLMGSALVSIAVAQSNALVPAPRTVARAAAPSFPYIQRNQIYTAITLGVWQLTKPATLLTSTSADAAPIVKLPVASQVIALQVEAHTLRAAVCEAVRNAELEVTRWDMGGLTQWKVRIPLAKGDRIYELGYYGEGECAVWIKGIDGLAWCGGNGLIPGPALCRYLGNEGFDVEIWAYVALPEGKRGWIKDPQAIGMSSHDPTLALIPPKPIPKEVSHVGFSWPLGARPTGFNTCFLAGALERGEHPTYCKSNDGLDATVYEPKKYHLGVDFRARPTDLVRHPIRPVWQGTIVAQIGNLDCNSYAIVLEHSGGPPGSLAEGLGRWFSVYGHVKPDSNFVKDRATVTQSDVLGEVNAPEKAKCPKAYDAHFHLGIFVGNDPEKLKETWGRANLTVWSDMGTSDRCFGFVDPLSFLDPFGFKDSRRSYNEHCRARYAMRKQDKWGFVDRNGTEVVEFKYERISSLEDIYAEMSSIGYYESDFFEGALLAVRYGGKWGFIDRDGAEVIKPQFEGVGDCLVAGDPIKIDCFAYGPAPVKQDGRWGYVNRLGLFVVEPQFDEALGFSDHAIARVKIGERYGVIDIRGRYVLMPQFVWIDVMDSGVIQATDEGRRSTLFDKTGKRIADLPNYKIGWESGEGLKSLQRHDGKVGVIELTTGHTVVPFQFRSIGPFGEGLAYAISDTQRGWIDQSGTFVLTAVADSGGLLSERTVAADSGGLFSEGLAEITLHGKSGFVDRNGTIVVKPQFDYVGQFRNGIALVRLGTKLGYVGKNGEVTFQRHFDSLGRFNGDRARARIEGRQVLVDRTGAIVYTLP